MYPLLGVVKIFISIDFSLVPSMVFFFPALFCLVPPVLPSPPFFPPGRLVKKRPNAATLGTFLPAERGHLVRASSCPAVFYCTRAQPWRNTGPLQAMEIDGTK